MQVSEIRFLISPARAANLERGMRGFGLHLAEKFVILQAQLVMGFLSLFGPAGHALVSESGDGVNMNT